MKKFNLLGGALLLCALAMSTSPYTSGSLVYFSEQSLSEARIKDGLIKAGRCPELCDFISDSGILVAHN